MTEIPCNLARFLWNEVLLAIGTNPREGGEGEEVKIEREMEVNKRRRDWES